ncbi:unnamed protein product, partial [Mesorhabditis spiculigera]
MTSILAAPILRTSDACPFIPYTKVSDEWRIAFAAFLFTFSVFGVFANLSLLLTILANHRLFLRLDVYPITLSMSFIGILYLLANFVVAIPVILNSFEFLEDINLMKSLAAVNTFTYYLEQAFLLIIAINRFLLFCSRCKDHTVKVVTRSLHLAAWIYGFALTLIPSYLGCFKIYSPRIIGFTFSCSQCGGAENTYVYADPNRCKGVGDGAEAAHQMGTRPQEHNLSNCHQIDG